MFACLYVPPCPASRALNPSARSVTDGLVRLAREFSPRIELHGDKLQNITSQPLLKKLAGELTPASIEPRGYYGLILFRRLTEHLYEHVKSEADRKRFAQDPIPNRHAAVHGLVTYSSMQNSLNAIFMAEYVFQVISFLKNPQP